MHVLGGHIKEALLDLTGAPCETIDFTQSGYYTESYSIHLIISIYTYYVVVLLF